MRILVATDGSGHSDAAIDAIARRPPPPGSEVRVISVVAPYFPTTYVSWEGMDVSRIVEMEKEVREQAHAAVENAAATLRAHEACRQLIISTDVLSGSPKRMILEDADAFGADVIVVGSHGRGMVERFVLGSVSQAVALHARCSVEIVRSQPTQLSGVPQQ